MKFFTDNFLNMRRQELLRSMKRFQYRIDGVWRDGTVNEKSIVGTQVVVYMNVPNFGTTDVITGVRVFDNNDALAGQQDISLVRGAAKTALVRFTFPLVEDEGDSE